MSEISLKFAYFGPFSFDLGNCLLTRSDREIPLRPKAARLLGLLIEAKGDLVSHAQLYRLIWGHTVVLQQDGLHQLVKDVRTALGEHGSNNPYVVNVPGRGYRFSANVTSKPQPATAPRGVQFIRSKVAFVSGFISFPIAFLTYCWFAAA